MADGVFGTIRGKVLHLLGDADCQNITVRGVVRGKSAQPTWVSRGPLGDPVGADLTTTSNAPSEISTALRQSVIVPPSGIVEATMAAVVLSNNNGYDAYLYVQTVGGTWFGTGALAMANVGIEYSLPGSYVFTGLAGGQRLTFAMGWSVCCGGGNSISIPCHSRGAAGSGTWLQVKGIP